MKNPYDYIAYIDEAGDDGLRAVKPISDKGSSEWLILSAVVIRAEKQQLVPTWLADLRGDLKRNHQARSVHFQKLSDENKAAACASLAGLDARYFVVASNKKNMQGHKNPSAEQIPSQCWFYCWMSRILLERVTRFIHQQSVTTYKEPRTVRLEYSARGGLQYSQMHAYYEWMKMKRENPFLPWGKIEWEVLDRDQFKVYPHYEREGLQLADIVASAFFKACDKHDTGMCNPRYAKLLEPRMGREPNTKGGRISGFGVKLLPNFKKANLDADQADIFKFYGYPQQWWDPEAFSKSPYSPTS